MHFILLGPPGSGKGTQADKICAKYLTSHISTGNVIRENIKKGTPFGKYAKEIIDKGNLIPDDKMIQVLQKEVRKYPGGVLLDGFPRTIPQAQALEKIMHIDKVIDVDVPDAVVIERITGRRSCPGCQTTYHTKYNPPKKNNVCDKCSLPLVQRNDDKEDVVKNRLVIYHRQTEPLIEYYKKKGILLKIDGTKDIDTVFGAITKALKK